MKVERFNYVQIMVKDLEKARQFFGDLLGVEFDNIRVYKEWDVINAMSLPIGKESIRVELITPLAPRGPVARALEKKGEGLCQISVKVPNLEEALAEMKSKGIRQINGPGHLFHPKDLYGVIIELN